jgi:hypothetical protein
MAAPPAIVTPPAAPAKARRGRTRKVGAWGRAIVLLASVATGCAPPQLRGETPQGDHFVTTWSRLFGLGSTKWNNVEAARETCPDGYILLGEEIGRDENGNYRRWEYGCLAR